MNFKTSKILLATFAAAMAMNMSSCLSEGEDTFIIEGEGYTNPFGIPDDSEAQEAPYLESTTMNLPGASTTVSVEDGWALMTVTMNGIWDDANGEWLRLKGTGYSDQNTWLDVDGTPKGIAIYNNADQESVVIPTDIVFLVDNSGSMSEEANAIANEIKDWVTKLEASGISIKVGCVGYGDTYTAIDGAINLTDVDEFKAYLDRYTGTSRTQGFAGADKDLLSSLAGSVKYNEGKSWGSTECGMVAWHFANDNFNFRRNSNRVYVNFTDEPNQPCGVERFSTEYLNPANNSEVASYGTIHTVYSSPSHSFSHSILSSEQPWKMSEYTGGTTIFTSSSFSEVTLEQLPVTGALTNSYVIRFTNIDDYMDGLTHAIRITVQTPDGNIRAQKNFYTIFGKKEAE